MKVRDLDFSSLKTEGKMFLFIPMNSMTFLLEEQNVTYTLSERNGKVIAINIKTVET